MMQTTRSSIRARFEMRKCCTAVPARDCSLDIFSCVFQSPEGRIENSPGLQPGFSPGIDMPKEIALKGRPNRIGYDVYRYIVKVFDAPVPFPVHAVFSAKDRWLFLHCEEIRIGTASSRFRRTFFSGNNARHSAALSGRCSRGCLPRAEAHGLFCFRPLGDTKCPNSRARATSPALRGLANSNPFSLFGRARTPSSH